MATNTTCGTVSAISTDSMGTSSGVDVATAISPPSPTKLARVGTAAAVR